MMLSAAAYINEPTRRLVEKLERLIRARRAWRECGNLGRAFKQFDAVCRNEPEIVSFVRKAVSNRQGSLTLDQIQLAMLSTFMRSSSTYGTVPELAAAMNLASDYVAGSKINDNALQEVGTSRVTSHASLLFDSFKFLADGIAGALRAQHVSGAFPPLTQASHGLLRQMFAMMAADEELPSNKDFRNILDKRQIYVPPFTDDDIQTARHYAALCDAQIAQYHNEVLIRVLRMSHRRTLAGAGTARRDPTDRGWLAQKVLEFCTRESSSVDAGRSISYIGAYRLLTDAYLGYVADEKQDAVSTWSKVHSDFDGHWGTSTEEGHARDALELVDQVFEGLSAQNAARAIRTAARLSERRLKHWRYVTDRLIKFGKNRNAIPVPFRFSERTQRHRLRTARPECARAGGA